ncbi:hypothetical protein KBY58_09630 [Cyanobium sp. HWJ4-Hawea]|uniref:hypothetical protein n=1 Tax=unclassified Cyanobium TaxID=2627006 RepID=UPI0020CDCB7A|nr:MULTISPECIES: hypothetical protein [unclassified Cyanobium]MCP9774017.1 hypothetical protein [Cyanobium sp. WAJ14-Wanaka]MCP9809691.1 hypothetical protein [Cyanobium sp. HWJ4-Hawea]
MPVLLIPLLLLAGLFPLAGLLPARAGVVFDNCQSLPGGAVSCDTRPTGNTRDDDEAARYGLFDQASPGWNEFDPEEGYNSMMGYSGY